MKQFTESQRRAVLARDPQVACVAGPGSGKTTVLVERVRALIDGGVAPAKVSVVTFTNAAARELEERLNHALKAHHGVEGQFQVRLGYCGTLHSLALRALRALGAGLGYGDRLAVVDEDAAADLLASKARSLGCKDPAKKLIELKRAGRPDLGARGRNATVAETALASYFDDLRDAGLVDLDSILPEFLRLLGGPGRPLAGAFDHLLVDEAQDSSEQDWAVYDALPVPNKFIVGDPDQAIYGFRGGRQDLFLNYARRPGVLQVTLEENFRCSPRVCDAANALIRHNVDRLDKRTTPAAPGPDLGVVNRLVFLNEGEEVARVTARVAALLVQPVGLKPPQVAVLARTNLLAGAFREALAVAGLAVDAPPKADLPPDWSLARALVELLAQPDNDTLAFFYVSARERRRGATAQEAAQKAHAVRLEAGKARRSVNALWFGLPSSPGLDELGRLLDREGISAETRAEVAARARALPPGSGVLELAADMAGDFRHVEQSRNGVTCCTLHAAKGREWDHVFLVGMDGPATAGAVHRDALEEERRLAFVGLTRARVGAYMSHALQRRETWGRRDLARRTPSPFIAEALP